jgi:hypothetical protein
MNLMQIYQPLMQVKQQGKKRIGTPKLSLGNSLRERGT